MARTPQNTIPTLLIISLITISYLFNLTAAFINNNKYHRNLSPKKLGLKREKLTHLHFYFHDIVSGQNVTSVPVATAQTTNSSATGFGMVEVADDRLTVGPKPTSKTVGRAQGIFSSASQSDLGLLMVLNYVFTEGKYKGSTLSILGRNAIFSKVREMPIVGGSGLFRFARGYAQARTYSFNTTNNNAVVEYNVYVWHY